MSETKKRRVKLTSSDASLMAQRRRKQDRADGTAAKQFRGATLRNDPKFVAWLADLDERVSSFNQLELEYMRESSQERISECPTS
jgi:hypothetical protein